ncbi:MAG: hypothetical protein ACOC23_06790 [Thermodesulfobacteriota bacterium]
MKNPMGTSGKRKKGRSQSELVSIIHIQPPGAELSSREATFPMRAMDNRFTQFTVV